MPPADVLIPLSAATTAAETLAALRAGSTETRLPSPVIMRGVLTLMLISERRGSSFSFSSSESDESIWAFGMLRPRPMLGGL